MIIIAIFAIYGLAFFIKNADGPWDLMAKLRNYLMLNKYVGVFFYNLLNCWACTGFHAGWIVYLLFTESFKLTHCVLWGLAGMAISLTFDAVLIRLRRE